MPPKKNIKERDEEQNIKKRGRPPKTKNNNRHHKFQEFNDEFNDDKKEEELVLYLPNFEENVTEKKNLFTMTDSDTSDTKTTKNIIKNISSSEDESDYGNDVTKLIEEINKRDIIIKTLRDNLKNYKNISQDNSLTITKENKKQLLNLGLISVNNNKLKIAETSPYACWWCTYNFDTYPLFLPEKFQNNKYYVFGNFCTFSCMFSYNDNIDDYRRTTRNSLIKKMYFDIFNSECNIKPAGPREILEKFGGPTPIDKYRDAKVICTKTTKINIPPMIPLLSYYEETILDKN
jgi:hypothetical protein